MDTKPMEEAVRYISVELKSNPDADRNILIEKASQQFDLNPLQSEFLLNKFVLGL